MTEFNRPPSVNATHRIIIEFVNGGEDEQYLVKIFKRMWDAWNRGPKKGWSMNIVRIQKATEGWTREYRDVDLDRR